MKWVVTGVLIDKADKTKRFTEYPDAKTREVAWNKTKRALKGRGLIRDVEIKLCYEQAQSYDVGALFQ